MLFQPTNIFPSMTGGLGNGVVDAAAPLTVSWQVNGTSAMTAFSITIYENDESSTQVYTTGQLTDGCPFYGTDYTGEIQYFSYTIPASALSGAGIANGNTYKLQITQWWSESDSVAQTSAAAFLTRAAPTLNIQTIPSPVPYRSYTFAADYAQAQGDAVMWFQWTIAEAGHEDTPIYDTGKIYGTGDVRVKYDGFFTGNYAIRCQLETANGVAADTGWVDFTVSYGASQLQGLIEARGCAGGVYLSWPEVRYISGAGSGDYSLENGVLELGDGGSVTWDSANGAALSLPAPWSFVWSGTMANSFTR